MPELYLRLLDRIMTPILLLLALFLLMRGHNQPGGGFIAGLVAAAAFQLQILSRGHAFVNERIAAYLHPLTGIGLLIAVSAATLGLVNGGFFKSVWVHLELGALEIEIGTPVIFDLGVFFVVVSVILSFLLGLSAPQRGDEA